MRDYYTYKEESKVIKVTLMRSLIILSLSIISQRFEGHSRNQFPKKIFCLGVCVCVCVFLNHLIRTRFF
ncbi:hypothetical protein PPACK8108_LOCUS17357 [Phakopsora pachyrhizi]|uniref:Uncharacterized protein n=1 Tax=Phakopsora pachyrhizi TaxID=170000 RepID=A0AAV0BBI3_PHAPC|nr:hypothetical protein PPACK8108_LOCUS17357 [Phakopsora pachyrhizi]